MVFNIGGNRFRLIVRFDYARRIGFVRFVGTHAEYDRIDASSVQEVPMTIKPIRNEADHDAALDAIDGLMGAAPNTADGDTLEVLVTLVEAYEAERWPMDAPDPVSIPAPLSIDRDAPERRRAHAAIRTSPSAGP